MTRTGILGPSLRGHPVARGVTALLLTGLMFLATGPADAATGPAVPTGGPVPVTIQESGLPSRLPWQILVASKEYTVNSSTLQLQEPPGTYPVHVLPVGQYYPNESTTVLQVSFQPVFWNFTFLFNSTVITGDNNSTNATGLFGLPGDEGYFVLLVAGLGVAALVSAVWLRRRGRRRPRTPQGPEERPEGGGKRPGRTKGSERPKGRPTRDERRRAQRRRERRTPDADVDAE